MKTNKLWFKAKLYGWGWRPVSWEGWTVMLLYLAGLYTNFQNVNMYHYSTSDVMINFSIPFIIDTIFLLIICYAHGEKPAWHWGK